MPVHYMSMRFLLILREADKTPTISTNLRSLPQIPEALPRSPTIPLVVAF